MKIHSEILKSLTDGIFESSAHGVPSKSQNPIVLNQGGPSSTECSNPIQACCWRHPFGTNNYPPFPHITKNKYSFPHWIFYFLLK